uniref:Uncharacterized protein n=1 Tax=Oryza sativa subsp. japonica TaxID=39947 RepID=Q5Z4I2_ORYSJ|nr:hypothetical protein [Oryza sativa Japonica Group]BAD62350.1 hypothetical protein [Oryza sativa Japonica Group]
MSIQLATSPGVCTFSADDHLGMHGCTGPWILAHKMCVRAARREAADCLPGQPIMSVHADRWNDKEA